MPKPDFPFADQTPWYPSYPTPWLGGMVVGVPSQGSPNPNLVVAHGLKRVPRFAWLLDAWTNTNIKHPMPRGISNWDYKNAYFNWPSMSQRALVLFG